MGLMGGSLALAIKKHKLAQQVIGYDQDQNTLNTALSNKVIQKKTLSIAEAMAYTKSANDLIIIAVPLQASEEIIKECIIGSSEALITEIGSAKGHLYKIYRDIKDNNKKIPINNFVPAHPVAGIEKNGFAHAFADIYKDHKCIITPFGSSSQEAVETCASFWSAIGSKVSFMDIAMHDRIFSYTSHLPHFLAYTLVESLSKGSQAEDMFRYAAGGFRDFTRIAASDEKMWSDIFITNRANILNSINLFQKSLLQMRLKLQQNDKKNLTSALKRARDGRQSFETISFVADKTKNNKPLKIIDKEFDYICIPCSKLNGEVRVASDKSISHRSVILASIAEGVSHISNFLPAEDTLNTVKVLKSMGADISTVKNNTQFKIKGHGLNSLHKPNSFLDCGNSGTAARLLCGLLSGQSFASQIRGDMSLSSRPMNRVIEPLNKMGARIYAMEGGYLPLLIMGSRSLRAIEYQMPIPSAQIKSALILAALYAPGETLIKETIPTRDHTERMLKNFGYKITITKKGTIAVNGAAIGKERINAANINIPADISSAAFFIVAASIIPNSSILLRDVGINPKRLGVITILQMMGANINIHNKRQFGNEPIADLEVTSTSLQGVDIPTELVPSAIDEMPIIMVAAAYAKGTTRIHGAEELRIKESDRIAAMVEGLKHIGVNAKALKDGAVIQGGCNINGGTVDSYGDHRIAMSFAVAACGAQSPIQIQKCVNVATSFPNFIECANSLGMNISEKNG